MDGCHLLAGNVTRRRVKVTEHSRRLNLSLLYSVHVRNVPGCSHRHHPSTASVFSIRSVFGPTAMILVPKRTGNRPTLIQ